MPEQTRQIVSLKKQSKIPHNFQILPTSWLTLQVHVSQ